MKKYAGLPKALQLYVDNLHEKYLFNIEATSVKKLSSIYDDRAELLKKKAAVRQMGKNLLKKLGKLEDKSGQDTNYIKQLETLALWYVGVTGSDFVKKALTSQGSGAGGGAHSPGGVVGDKVFPPGGGTGDDGLPVEDAVPPLEKIEAQVNKELLEDLNKEKYDEYGAKFKTLTGLIHRGDLEGIRSIDPKLAIGLELLYDPSKVNPRNTEHISGLGRALFYSAYRRFINGSKFIEPEDKFDAFKRDLKIAIRAAFEDGVIDRSDMGDAFDRFLQEQARRGITYKKPQDAVSAFLSWVHDPNVSPWYKFSLAIGAPLLLGGLLAAVISEKPTAGLVASLLGLAGTGYGVYGFIQNRIKENEGPRVEVKTPPPPGWKPIPPEKRIPSLLVDPKEVRNRLEANGARRRVLSSFIDNDAFVRMVGDMRSLDIIAYLEKLDDYTLVGDLFGTLNNTRYPAEDRFIILDNFMKRGLEAGLHKILTDDQEYDKFIAMYGYETNNPRARDEIKNIIKERKRQGARNALQAYKELTQYPSISNPKTREQMINIFANNIWSVFTPIKLTGAPTPTVGEFTTWLKQSGAPNR